MDCFGEDTDGDSIEKEHEDINDARDSSHLSPYIFPALHSTSCIERKENTRDMNAILEYPLEALVFDYLSFGFSIIVINSVWTWVAVITAGVGFWRFKISSTLPALEPRGDLCPCPPTPTLGTMYSSSSSLQVERLLSTPSTLSVSKETSSIAAFLKGTKGKVTVHFKQDDGEEGNGNEDGDEEGEDDGVELSKEWYENWERLLKMRNGEMGWYYYQDMKVIDGNIVRLWDGCRRRREAEKTAFSVSVVSAW
ncbi:hypothetical protein K7X08_012012 [Anisodus acutangulus]|uniref:Uncharacterized protein n=1 Tax=Anisodus acutangulus TaxID=402998 RepID=A0A9Q1QYP6_9SOLA|nr:hypothetical protein K7X08_012012 [Anisodus acutangulus]